MECRQGGSEQFQLHSNELSPGINAEAQLPHHFSPCLLRTREILPTQQLERNSRNQGGKSSALFNCVVQHISES